MQTSEHSETVRVDWFASQWRAVRAGLLAIVDKFSNEELTYVAFDGGYSAGEILLHIAQEELGEVQYGLTRVLDTFPPPYRLADYPTTESIKDLLASVHAETERFLEGMTDEDLDREVEAQWGDRRSLLDFLWHVLEHEIHHRGELSFLLGLLGREGLDA